MRVAVYNRHWATAGGGERFAGGIAEVLSEQHRVTLIGHEAFDVGALGERLQLDLSRVEVAVIGPGPEAVTAASAAADVFVNASYASDDRSACPRSLYVVHFPALPPFHPGRSRRLAISGGARVAALAGIEATPARVIDGAYMAETVAGLPVRWTDGGVQLDVPGRFPLTLLLGRFQPPEVGDLEVEALLGGRVVARTVVHPRRSRFDGLVTRLPIPPVGAGRHRLTLRSRSWSPLDLNPASADRRRLGVALVAITAGRHAAGRLLQGGFQALAVPSATASFLDSYQIVVANSAFTQGWVRRLWGRESDLLYPPVLAQPPLAKATMILGVGRFFPPGTGHCKRQLELVRAFRRLDPPAGWELHLAGGCDVAGRGYLAEVEREAKGLAVRFHVNVSGSQLRELYGRASLFWHATGLGEDEEAHPEHFEHFGITTVEAMSAGAVPLVIAKAGQLELFEDGEAGVHWADVEQLVAATRQLIDDPARRAHLASGAQLAAERFLRPAFARRLGELVDRLGQC